MRKIKADEESPNKFGSPQKGLMPQTIPFLWALIPTLLVGAVGKHLNVPVFYVFVLVFVFGCNGFFLGAQTVKVLCCNNLFPVATKKQHMLFLFIASALMSLGVLFLTWSTFAR
jgi:hypothetical protein